MPVVETPNGPVSLDVRVPRAASAAAPAIVLAHGAGTDMYHPSVVRVCTRLEEAGYPTVRFNFPYREAGRKAPDRQLVLQACYRAVLGALRSDRRLAGRQLVIGGRSMGGRTASHLVADGEPADGLLLLAFPLHQPGRPATERAAHLDRITVPMLFVQGTRDRLATWELIERTVTSLPGATLHAIEDGDHGFRVPKRRASADEVLDDVVGAIVTWLRTLGG